MKNMQSSVEVEETFVDGAIESLESLPAATNTHELDVSIVKEHCLMSYGSVVVVQDWRLLFCTYTYTYYLHRLFEGATDYCCIIFNRYY